MNFRKPAIASLASLPLLLSALTPGLLAATIPNLQSPKPNRLSVVSSNGSQIAQSSARCISSFRFVRTQDGGRLNLRERPGTQSRVIGTIPNGTEVLYNIGDRSGEWAEVTIRGGQTGWVATRFLSQPTAKSISYPTNLRVKTLEGGSLNVRASVSTSSAIIDTVANGTLVKAHKPEGYWTQITTPRGVKGFVASSFLACN